MLVLPHSNGSLTLVAQPEHAAHAARIAERWRRPQWMSPAIWARFIEAVRRHDDGWITAERHPAVGPDGRPLPFDKLETDEHLRLLVAGIDRLSADDLYAGLLAALHFRHLETHFPDNDPTSRPLIQRFIDKVDERVDAALRMLQSASGDVRRAVEPGNLAMSRTLLSVADALSLMLLGGVPWKAMTIRLPAGEEAIDVEVSGSATTATLRPWPFEGPAFEVAATARCLPVRPYVTRTALAEAMQLAEPVTVVCSIRPA